MFTEYKDKEVLVPLFSGFDNSVALLELLAVGAKPVVFMPATLEETFDQSHPFQAVTVELMRQIKGMVKIRTFDSDVWPMLYGGGFSLEAMDVVVYEMANYASTSTAAIILGYPMGSNIYSYMDEVKELFATHKWARKTQLLFPYAKWDEAGLHRLKLSALEKLGFPDEVSALKWTCESTSGDAMRGQVCGECLSCYKEIIATPGGLPALRGNLTSYFETPAYYENVMGSPIGGFQYHHKFIRHARFSNLYEISRSEGDGCEQVSLGHVWVAEGNCGPANEAAIADATNRAVYHDNIAPIEHYFAWGTYKGVE